MNKGKVKKNKDRHECSVDYRRVIKEIRKSKKKNHSSKKIESSEIGAANSSKNEKTTGKQDQNPSKNTGKVERMPVKGEEEKKKVTKKLKNSFLFDDSSQQRSPQFWPYLDIRGPLPKSRLLSLNTNRNHHLIKVFREITEQIHENLLKFRETFVMKLQERKDVPKLEEVMNIVEKMYCETMKVDNIHFDVFGISDLVRGCFEQKTKLVVGDSFPEFLEQLQRIFEKRGVAIGQKRLMCIRLQLLSFFFNISIDLVNSIVSLKIDNEENLIRIEGFRRMDIFSDECLLSDTTFDNLADVANLIALLQKNHMDRTTSYVSLWTTIPCEHEDNEHLLEHVFESGLIRLLPKEVKSFLTTWMIGVRKVMRNALQDEYFKKIIKANVGDWNDKSVNIEINHKKIKEFLMEVNGSVLNCVENFNIFGEEWADSVIEFIQTPLTGILRKDEMRIINASGMETKATAHLSAMFSDSPSDQCLLIHTLLQLYRFLIYFSYATIRHVFHSKEAGILVFDWNLEATVTDFRSIMARGENKRKRGESGIRLSQFLPQKSNRTSSECGDNV